MDSNSNSLQSTSDLNMAELFMECEEEELEPWQKKIEEQQEEEEEDDDELIFVGEISSSRPAISNILNRGTPSSSSKAIKNETVSQGDSFKPAAQQSKESASSSSSVVPRFYPESKSSQRPITPQSMSRPGFAKNVSHLESDDSSELLFDLTQDPIPLLPQTSQDSSEGADNKNVPHLKRPSTSRINSVSPKKPKMSESAGDKTSSLSSLASCSEASSTSTQSNSSDTSSVQDTTGMPFQKTCPKCNIQFNLSDPLKYHMKRCCPDMIGTDSDVVKIQIPSDETQVVTTTDKGKLIMLVSDFYYGKHEGAVDEEQKTYTTFKCFSCLKVLKNNIRFMNHMKHHLEFEKQNSESWENHTTCQHCYRQYPTPFQLQCHIESTHTPHEFSTICKICELSFESEHILLQHMKDTHKPGEMPYICQVCQFRSSTFSDVENHFRTCHENTKNLLCPFCLKVSRMATPYMNHYMKHQKKGIHRCTKCRLQFLTCKEKIDHKAQHRTFIKPKELEGLPPGTKVTIRASVGSHSRPSVSSSCNIPSTSSFQVSSLDSRSTTTKSPVKANAGRSSTGKSNAGKSSAGKSNTGRSSAGKSNTGKSSAGKSNTGRSSAGRSTTGRSSARKSSILKAKIAKAKAVRAKAVKTNVVKSSAGRSSAGRSGVGRSSVGRSNVGRSSTGKYKTTKAKTRKTRAAAPTVSKTKVAQQGKVTYKRRAKASLKQKKQQSRKNKLSVALKKLRYCRGTHECIECHTKIKDFASHFSVNANCNFCKYHTNCNKAFANHMASSHSDRPSKRFSIFKKHSGTPRGITLVCLKCDFLEQSSGLDLMAKHLSQRKTHTCQVIVENVSESVSTPETTADNNVSK